MLFYLIAGHFLADYPFQSDAIASCKCRKSQHPAAKGVPWWYWLTAHAFASSTRNYVGWNLPSGLAVLYRSDTRFPVVRVVVAVRGGTADAPEGKRAVAHLAEHLAFRAVLDGEPIGVALRAAGCVSNATTGLDYTTYFMECPIDAADVPLRFALSLAVHDLPGLTDAAVAVEAQVVQHETTQRQDAGNYTDSRLTLPVFTGDHPYHIADAGLDEVVSVSLADVQGFFSRHYTPGNTVMVVEGDLLPHALAESVARLSGDGVAHPRQRRGEVAVWPGGGMAWLTLDDLPVTWFRDPEHPDQALPRGPTIELIPRPAPAPPAPDTAPRRITVSGGLRVGGSRRGARGRARRPGLGVLGQPGRTRVDARLRGDPRGRGGAGRGG